MEYYRLWGGDSGTWDTDVIDIPSNTPDDKVDSAIRKAVAKIKWRDEPPVIVGYYCDSSEEEDEDEDGDVKRTCPPSTMPEDRDQAINNLLAKAEEAGLETDDLDEIVHELSAALPPTSTTRAWKANSAT